MARQSEARALMVDQLDIGRILFLDIETVAATRYYSELSPLFQQLWERKARQKYPAELADLGAAELYSRAGLFAEFGRVVCVSVGLFQSQGPGRPMRLFVKSFTENPEANLLYSLAQFLDELAQRPDETDKGKLRVTHLCAHNGREFDYPYLCRRMMACQVALPELLRIQNKPAWELKHLLDTMELWKFGDYKAFTSLELLAAVFGIPTPKDDITGADVYPLYYEQSDLARITRYCQKDVVTLARLMQCYRYEVPVPDEDVVLPKA